MPRIHLVAFDLFGTLVRTRAGNKPYRKVLDWSRQNGRAPRDDDARTIMTTDAAPGEIFVAMDIHPPTDVMDEFQKAIEADLQSIELFDDVLRTIMILKEKGVQIAVCSNLAKPYSAALELLPRNEYIKCLSFESCAVKPEPRIYECLTVKSGISRENILFVGDSLIADYNGPTEYGFHALHLVRETRVMPAAPDEHVILSLESLLEIESKTFYIG